MSYRRDFTIGLRETRNFYLTLVLGSWKKGILAFGLVGALAVVLYLPQGAPALQVLAVLAGAAAAMGLITLWLAVSTCVKVRSQRRRSGRGSYVQETEIDGFGVHVAVGKDRAKLGFDRLRRVQETRGAFYVYISDNQAWILPKAQMEDRAAECAQLRQIFQTVVERGRLRLRKG